MISLSIVLIILGVLAGLARGGKLTNLASANFRWPGLVFAGLGIQVGAELYAAFIDPGLRHGGRGMMILISSYLLLIAFVVINRRLPGLGVIGAGLALNLLVIALNDGMPVSARSAEIAGIGSLGFLETEIKHRLMTSATRLPFLGDIIPLPVLGKVISVGDVVLGLGIFLLVERTVRYDPKRLRPAPSAPAPGAGP